MDGLVSVLKWVLLVTGCITVAVHAQTRPLNDTGQTLCYTSSNAQMNCDDASTGNSSARPHQDGRYGRDAESDSSQLGVSGFDFSCVLWSGSIVNGRNCWLGLKANGEGTASGTPETDWACTKDNVTGLLWSLQSQGTVTWIEASGGTYPNTGHNSANRCGFSTGWRLPTRRELLSIVHSGLTSSPMIDANFFPKMQVGVYWSNNGLAFDQTGAWMVTFANGTSKPWDKTNPGYVVLVRSGP